MLPVIWALARAYAPVVMFPVALVIGIVGYNVEKMIRDPNNSTHKKQSVKNERQERQLKQFEESQFEGLTNVESIKKKQFVPKNIFERNVSPSLQQQTQQQENNIS